MGAPDASPSSLVFWLVWWFRFDGGDCALGRFYGSVAIRQAGDADGSACPGTRPSAAVRRGTLPGRDDQSLTFCGQCLNDGLVIRLPAIPVAGRRAANGQRLRIGLAHRHRAPLSRRGRCHQVATPVFPILVAQAVPGINNCRHSAWGHAGATWRHGRVGERGSLG